MAEVQSQPTGLPAATDAKHVRLAIPPSSLAIPTIPSRLRNRLGLDAFSPVNQNGSFEFDRVIKSGYVQKRTSKTKVGHPCNCECD